MPPMTDVAVIGAGPYGLAIAAHLAARGVELRIFGQPMQTWRTAMPKGMVLKSEGFASNLYDPEGAFTLGAYCAQQGLPYADVGLPVPLETFAAYGLAFQQRFVPMLDQRRVAQLEPTADGFALSLDDGARVTARRVVVASGICAFDTLPAELAPLRGPLVSHSVEHHDLSRFAGREVLVIGGGSSGLDLAALLDEQGSAVTVAARAARLYWCEPPRPRSLLDKISAPMSGLGTGWRSLACVLAPMVFYQMPPAFRVNVVRKHLGPAPGWTSRERVERNVPVLLNAALQQARTAQGRVEVTLRLGDGSRRTIVADHVIAATGYKVDLRRLAFLGPRLQAALRRVDQAPALSRRFESSVPGLFFIGSTAANSFGPLLRFAYGAGFAASRLSRHLHRTAAPARVTSGATLVHAGT